MIGGARALQSSVFFNRTFVSPGKPPFCVVKRYLYRLLAPIPQPLGPQHHYPDLVFHGMLEICPITVNDLLAFDDGPQRVLSQGGYVTFVTLKQKVELKLSDGNL